MIRIEENMRYWIKLFPEIENDERKLCKIYKNCTLKDIKEEILSESPFKNNFISVNYDNDFLVCIKELKEEHDMPFVEIFMSILMDAYKRLKYGIINCEYFDNIKNIIRDFIYDIYVSIYRISFRICIQELNISKINGNLIGKNEKEEFDYYTHYLLNKKDYIKYFYKEYPGLYYELSEKSNYMVSYFLEITNHIIESKEDLISMFLNNKKENFIVEEIILSSGDSHQGSKSVAIVKFKGNYKIVYKPRPLNIDEGFKNFCDWLNDKNINGYLKLESSIILNNGKYGWMSFVEYKACESEVKVLNYYKRIGQLLALLYIFDSKDFHHENIIANGEMPILIDLETLFHGTLDYFKSGDKIYDMKNDIIQKSVLETMLLPRRIQINLKDNKSIDIGGISAFENQETPLKVPTVINHMSSDMKVIYKNSVITPERNVPKVDGKDHIETNKEHIYQIIDGFNILYDWIFENKEEVITIVSQMFNNSYCRLIVKPTHEYSTLLRIGTHPDLYFNPLHKKVFLCRVGLNNISNKNDILNSYEYKDLLKGDIPYFTTTFNDSKIYDSSYIRIKGVKLKVSPLQNFIDKIRGMCEKDKRIQNQFINWSFIHMIDIDHSTRKYNLKYDKKYSENKILNLADEISNIIMNKSILIDNNCEWLGIGIDGATEEMTSIGMISNDLYKGLTGIGLFFSYLYRFTLDYKYELYTKLVCTQIIEGIKSLSFGQLKKLSEDKNNNLDIGGFTGLGGTLYGLYHIFLNINDRENLKVLIDKIILIYKSGLLSNRVDKDIIGGICGYLMMLLSVYEKENDVNKKLEIKNIILSIEKDMFGKNKIDVEGYTGFAHGTSGAISTLARINNKFSENREKRLITIKKMLEHERKLFSLKTKNWYVYEGGNDTSVGWCNGASGILLSRVLLKKYGYFDDMIDNEIELAKYQLITNGLGNNITLCHGDIGNILIFMEYVNITNNEIDRKVLNSMIYEVIEYIDQNKYKKLYENVDIYGLMVGRSGEGYFLLKILFPEINNILFLE